MAAEGPETGDGEAALKVRSVEGITLLGLAAGAVGAFRFLVAPLLLVGDGFDEEPEDDQTGEDQVRDSEGGGCRGGGGGRFGRRREENEEVCWRGNGPEEQVLRQADEQHVEQEPEESVVDDFAQRGPAIVFRAELVAAFPSVVECQSRLESQLVSNCVINRITEERVGRSVRPMPD